MRFLVLQSLFSVKVLLSLIKHDLLYLFIHISCNKNTSDTTNKTIRVIFVSKVTRPRSINQTDIQTNKIKYYYTHRPSR